MRARVAALAALGLIVIGGGLLAARSILVDEPAAAFVPDAVPAPVIAPPVGKTARVRRVAPEIVAQPQVKPNELERVEPRDALSRFGQPLPKPPPRNLGRVYRPYIDAAGHVSGSGVAVTIAGLEITPVDKTCTDADGRDWPCGVRARAAFRSFVRGRALACDLPETLLEKSYTVACALGGRDVGEWLVSQGWALALPGGPYTDAGLAARAADLGVFGSAPAVFAEPADDVAQETAGDLPSLMPDPLPDPLQASRQAE